MTDRQTDNKKDYCLRVKQTDWQIEGLIKEGQTERWTDGHTYKWTERWMDEGTEGLTYKWTDRQTGGQKDSGLTDGPTYKWIERQGNRKIDRQMDVRTDGLT
jgi:hypothetical protein